MKEIRPSTWVTLIVLALLIFVPAFFIDVEPLQRASNSMEHDNSIKPMNPFGQSNPGPANKPEPDNKPPANESADLPGNEHAPVD